MAVRLAINGFGRIGRLIMRAAIENKRRDVEIVAINDLGPVETNAHLLQYDSVHGKLLEKVLVDGNGIQVGNSRSKVTAEKDPAKLPWGELGIDVALECTHIEIEPGDLLLICSDGFYNMLSDVEMLALLQGSEDHLGDLARRAVDAANRAGGLDNITIILENRIFAHTHSIGPDIYESTSNFYTPRHL